MAKSDYQFIGSELEKWLNEYFNKNGNIEGDSIEIKSFIDELYQKISVDYDMISLPKDAQGILYAGSFSDIPMWQIVDGITEQTDNYYYISDTAAGILMGKDMSAFQQNIERIIGADNVDIIFNGTDKYCSAIYGMEDTLSFNDFVSQNLANKYVGNDGNAIIFASNYNPDSVLFRTEIPTLLDKDCVKTINGISKSDLMEYYNAYKLIGDAEANKKLASVISSSSEQFLAEIDIVKLTSEQITDLISNYGEAVVGKHVTNLGVLIDTSAWSDNTGSPIKDVASDITIEDTIKQYIVDNNQNSRITNATGLDDFNNFQNNKLTNAELMDKYKFLEADDSAIDMFRMYEYQKNVTGIDVTDTKVYFDADGKVTGLSYFDDSVSENAKLELKLSDIQNHADTTILSTLCPDYNNLTNVQKLQLAQLELEARNHNSGKGARNGARIREVLGLISVLDSICSSLKVWVDANKDGVSTGELLLW